MQTNSFLIRPLTLLLSLSLPAYAAAAAKDRSAPSTPAGLTLTAVSSNAIALAWQAASDNVKVTGYRIYRGACAATSTTQIATSTTPSYNNTGLSPATCYSYQVAAYDAAGNVSAKSAILTANTTNQVTSACPAFPTGLSCTPAPTSALCVNVTDTGATPNDDGDDRAAIQAAIDAAAGGGRVYFPPGTYRIDAVTRLTLKSYLTLDLSSGAVLQAIANNKTNFAILRGDDVSGIRIVGGTFQGERSQHTGTTGEWGHGIECYGCSDVVIENSLSKDNWGDGFYIGKSSMTGNTSNNIRACSITADNNRRQGLSITSANGVQIGNSTFKNTNGTLPEAGIDLEPNSTETVKNVTINSSRFENNRGAGVSFDASSTNGSHAESITVTGNTVTGNGANRTAALRLSYAVSNTITGNSVTFNKDLGLYMEDHSASNLIDGNQITNNGNVGVVMYNVEGNQVTNNTLKDNTGGVALVIDTAKNNTVTGNSGNGTITNKTVQADGNTVQTTLLP